MKKDLIDLHEHVWSRFIQRMDGLGDAEWSWRPVDEAKISLTWRLEHIGDMLGEQRNADWLGLPERKSPIQQGEKVHAAAEAIARVTKAYNWWMDTLKGLPEAELQSIIGSVAGNYGEASRYSFVLHVADELIHHTAEAALLRDFYERCSAGAKK